MAQEKAIIRLISKSIPWQKDYQLRPAAVLKWDVYLDDEQILLGSKRPFEDATALLIKRGTDPESLVTMRHEGKSYDSFVPIKLELAAKPGLKRMAEAEKLKAYFEARKNDGNDGLEP